MDDAFQRQLDQFLNVEIDVQRCIVALRQGDLSTQGVVQMCTAINAKLNGLGTQIAELEMDVQGIDGPAPGAEAAVTALAQHKQEVDTLRSAVRNAAQLHNRKMASQRFQREKLELLRTASGSKRKDATLASDMVQSLQRARGLISRELEKSNDTIRLLDEGSEKLKHTFAEYQQHRSVVSSNTQLLNKLATRMLTDAIFVYLAFAVYVAVCLYIVWRRVF
eukprot:EG_transcript_26093